jgi:hypothetical protein
MNLQNPQNIPFTKEFKGTKKLLRSGSTELYKDDVDSKVQEIINRASYKQLYVESILNGESPNK